MDATNSHRDVSETIIKLNEIFGNNLKMCLESNCEKLKSVDVNARYFAALGQILREKGNLLQSQQQIVTIFDEIFADIILSVYLAGCSLDKPAQIVSRRALEMGIAIVYLWDLPHEFWGWKCHDKDLQFKNMILHLSNDNYKTFIKSINSQYSPDDTLNFDNVTKLYRDLSNTTHGKISTLETSLPDSFSYNYADWEKHLDTVEKVQNVLMGLFNMRFFDICHELDKKMPLMK